MPTAFCFVHASDLHLDVPFQGLRRASTAATDAMCRAPLAAWDALVQLTIDRDAAFLLLAGDICDGAERAVSAHVQFMAGLERLSARGVRTFLIRGGSDPHGAWAGIPQWPQGVRCFGSDRVESVAVFRGGERMATIHGVSRRGADGRNLAAGFQRGDEPGLHVGLLHTSAHRGESTVAGAPAASPEWHAGGMDYWALGHEHRHRTVSNGAPWVVYPGTLQGRGFTTHEIGPKGAVVVSVEDATVARVAFQPLDTVRLVIVETEVSGVSDIDAISRDLHERAAALGEGGGRTVIARAVLHGTRSVSLPTGSRPDALGPLVLNGLRDHPDAPGVPVWWDSVVDLTAPAASPPHDYDPAARLRAIADALRRDPARLKQFVCDEAAPLAPRGVVPQAPLDPGDLESCLARAERLALDYLGREQL